MIDWNLIECFCYDFDGVMTDNRVWIDQEGRESVSVNRSDGLAVSMFKKEGIRQVIVSTETNCVVARRAEKLKIPVIHGVSDKAQAIEEYCRENDIALKHVMFIGNDINDISGMEKVGFKGAPCDAEQEILEIADWVSAVQGGRGVVRDLYREWSLHHI